MNNKIPIFIILFFPNFCYSAKKCIPFNLLFLKGPEREWNFGFGFGASWMCVILMFLSEVLLICDRESEEIFYKERDAEEGEGEEEEEKEDA